MKGGFWRTSSRSFVRLLLAFFGTFFIRMSEVIEPSGSIWITRVLEWASERTWSWFTG